jgi:hypothetical protein
MWMYVRGERQVLPLGGEETGGGDRELNSLRKKVRS